MNFGNFDFISVSIIETFIIIEDIEQKLLIMYRMEYFLSILRRNSITKNRYFVFNMIKCGTKMKKQFNIVSITEINNKL